MLANWMFFWDWNGAPPASATATVVISPGAGSGRFNDNEYTPLPDEYWESYATALKDRIPATPAVRPAYDSAADRALLVALRQERTDILATLPTLPTIADVRAASSYLKRLDSEIARISRKIESS